MARKNRSTARNAYGASNNGAAPRGVGSKRNQSSRQEFTRKRGKTRHSTVATQNSYRQAHSAQQPGAMYSAGNASGQHGDYSRYSADYSSKSHKKRMGRGKKVLVICLVVLACLIGGGGIATALYVNNLNSNLQNKDAKEAAEIKDSLAPAVSNEPFYMLLIGCDDRDGVDGARADTTILVRVDPANAKVTLVSIPRDTAITISGYGTQKFNAAYTYGGASGTIDAASQLCGVKISHYAEVHFDNLVDLINYMGGVTVDVPIAIDDDDAGGSLSAGVQTLNGEEAMIFARSRSFVTGDFQRTTDQRILIEAAINKIMSMPATDLPGLITKMSQCVTTDYNVTDLISLASAFQNKGNITMYSAMLPSTTADLNGVSYVVADTTTLKKMMSIIDSGGDPSTVATDYTVESSSESTSTTTGTSGTTTSSTTTSSSGSFARESAG